MDLVEMVYKEGVLLTIGSDTYKPKNVAQNINLVLEQLKENKQFFVNTCTHIINYDVGWLFKITNPKGLKLNNL